MYTKMENRNKCFTESMCERMQIWDLWVNSSVEGIQSKRWMNSQKALSITTIHQPHPSTPSPTSSPVDKALFLLSLNYRCRLFYNFNLSFSHLPFTLFYRSNLSGKSFLHMLFCCVKRILVSLHSTTHGLSNPSGQCNHNPTAVWHMHRSLKTQATPKLHHLWGFQICVHWAATFMYSGAKVDPRCNEQPDPRCVIKKWRLNVTPTHSWQMDTSGKTKKFETTTLQEGTLNFEMFTERARGTKKKKRKTRNTPRNTSWISQSKEPTDGW